MITRRPIGDLEKEYYVYCLYGRNAVLLYVGITNKIHTRLFQQHAVVVPWWQRVTEATVEAVEDIRAARRLESHYIKTRVPVYNRQRLHRSRRQMVQEEMDDLRSQRDAWRKAWREEGSRPRS